MTKIFISVAGLGTRILPASKRSIASHFEPHPELEAALEARGKTALIGSRDYNLAENENRW